MWGYGKKIKIYRFLINEKEQWLRKKSSKKLKMKKEVNMNVEHK